MRLPSASATRISQAQLRGDEALVHHAVGNEVLVLAVAHDKHIEIVRILHRKAQQVGIGNRLAVVRNRNDTGLLHPANLRHLLAFKALADRAHRIDMNAAALPLRLLQDIARHGSIVVDRVGIRHAAHAREAAARSSLRAGNQVFLIFLARIAQMAVHIDKARRNDAAFRFDHLRAIGREILPDGSNLSVFNKHVRNPVDSVFRIDHTAAADKHRTTHPYASLLVSM